MKYTLSLLRPVTTTNDFGERVTSYEAAGSCRAELVKHTGKRSEEVSEHFPDYSAEFNIARPVVVEENWRAQHMGGHLYTVTNIIPNLEKNMKTLRCERVNE